ncbi:MAG: hypothetical protein H7Y04_15745 [Verrucomicrobia bacterium]|nr:hypothetical protein [Cytophagales bacterium]
MQNQIHTVLRASGAMGRAVIQELKNRNLTTNAVERTAKPDGSIKANLLNEDEAVKAIQH